jgi:hypothetical protein
MRFYSSALAGSLAVAISSTSHAEAPFDLAKLPLAVVEPAKVSAFKADPIIVSAIRREHPKLEVRKEDQKRIAAIQSEAGFLVLNAIDAAQTINCLGRNECVEINPILGKHPSAAKVILLKAAMSAIHVVAFKSELKKNPTSALRLAQISCVLQGSVVGMHADMSFR